MKPEATPENPEVLIKASKGFKELQELEKLIYTILIPFCSGIYVFRGLAVQVGATWSIKSLPGDARGGQNGGQDGKRGDRYRKVLTISLVLSRTAANQALPKAGQGPKLSKRSAI